MKSNQNNFGILDIQIYFPSYYVSQKELEVFDSVPEGKYTIGLGQEALAFVSDNEDINSISLTVIDKLLSKNSIDPKRVGRIEIGTETIIDKSKSIKTHLMELFKESNCDIEGVTSTNACYGGTQALLNAFDWMTSSYYDGRYAIVLCADIAVYSKGNARPTGGAGAIAMLLGPNATIVLETTRASFMANVYDFYKPNPISEYPIVDGKLSLNCYLKALNECLISFKNKKGMNCVNDFDYFAFHSPYSKLTEKAFMQLCLFDINNNSKRLTINERGNYNNDLIRKVNECNRQFWLLEPMIQNEVKRVFLKEHSRLIEPTLFLCKKLGNLYTGSLYGCLLSLIINTEFDMTGKRIMMFSYGSGLASTLFSLKVISNKYQDIRIRNNDIPFLLLQRKKISPLNYEKILTRKEELFLKNNWIPIESSEHLFDNTYYLTKVDDKWRRSYKKKTINNSNAPNKEITFNQLSNPVNRIILLRNQLVANNTKNSGNGSNNKCTNTDFVVPSIWNGFHKKSILERQLQIKKVYPNVSIEKLKEGGLSLLRADNMVENCIGVLSLPIGLGLNFLINSKEYAVPMSTEEPSVIAAASGAAKLISENDGFFCIADQPYMITQIHYEYPYSEIVKVFNGELKTNLISFCNNLIPKMVQRGGGVHDVLIRKLNNDFTVIEILINVCDSMGANLLNTIAEESAKFLEKYIPKKPLMKILSNLSVYRKTTAEFKINLKHLDYKGIPGEEIAKNIIKAYQIALIDPFRASTHNKGIMNGIDAAAVALGQDFRAIESAIHSYASIDPDTFSYSSYRPLTHYQIIEIKGQKYLYGSITIPLAVGTVGGAINSNDSYKNMMIILGNPNALQLSHILASVGLAQNFAALRALVSEGIQKGHIGLHAKNISYRVGVPDYLIADVVSFMKTNNNISEDSAKKYLESLKLYNQLRKTNGKVNEIPGKLSSFYIDINFSFLKEPITMNFLIKTSIVPSINCYLTSKKTIEEDSRIKDIYKNLFGTDKQTEWLFEFMMLVHELDLCNHGTPIVLGEIYQIKYKLKLIIILLFVICSNLLKFNYDVASKFLIELLNPTYTYDKITKLIPSSSSEVSLEFGLTLVHELYEISIFYLNNYMIHNIKLYDLIKAEIVKSIKNFISINELYSNIKQKKIALDIKIFEVFIELRFTRLNAEVLLLCDLGFNDKKYTDKEIKQYIAFGRYAEIKITLLRDLHKAKKQGSHYLNSFLLFEKLQNSLGVSDCEIIKQKYLGVKERELKELNQIISNIQNGKENGNDILNHVEKSLFDYYSSKIPKAKL